MASPDDRPLNTRTRTIDYRALVEEAEGGPPEKEHDAYQFSTKTFKETDEQGVYQP